MKHITRRTFIAVAKLALAIAILAYLIVQGRDAFERLVEKEKNWPLLAAGFACTLTGITLNFVRWHLLIRAVGINVRLTDTLRLGTLGYALNFVSPGSIGGDFFKAIFLAHGQPGRRTEAVATVLADRLMGVMTLLVLASGAILAIGLLDRAPPALKVLCETICIATGVAVTGATLLLLVPGLSGGRVSAWAQSVPLAGRTLARLIGTVRAYRDEKRLLMAAAGVSVVSNVTFITSFYLVASGLPVNPPTWGEHMVLVPIANVVGAIPATPAGLGTKELAVEALYPLMPTNRDAHAGDGTMVTLAHRLTEISVALIGLVYYLSHRREVEEVYEEAEELVEEGTVEPV